MKREQKRTRAYRGIRVERVDVPPFHAPGADKYAALGLDHPCAGVTPPSAGQVGWVRAAFTAAGLRAV